MTIEDIHSILLGSPWQRFLGRLLTPYLYSQSSHHGNLDIVPVSLSVRKVDNPQLIRFFQVGGVGGAVAASAGGGGCLHVFTMTNTLRPSDSLRGFKW